MITYFVIFFMVIGAVFILIASIGLLKMPDIYLRMSASTIGGTFGVASMLIAAAIHFFNLGIFLHVVGVIIFLILTVPIGAHLLARAAYIIRLPMWDKTVHDDLEGKYDNEKQVFKTFGKETATPKDIVTPQQEN
ncbi:MAG: monovalent cation/H(+) antiporter subunit G [Bacteroidetes bacterium]|jgi:multicomponent Na+:H+ antiporter subunit G|nr:monovalent cation/H(+) antiporter subunit G [Bacteroidota bacterium]